MHAPGQPLALRVCAPGVTCNAGQQQESGMTTTKTANEFLLERALDSEQGRDPALVETYLFLSDLERDGIQSVKRRLGAVAWNLAVEKAARCGVKVLE